MNVPIGSHTKAIGGQQLFEIDTDRHTLITGKSGVGKSTMLINLAIWHIRNGDGLLFIDPHGDAANTVLKHIPKRRLRDVVIIDPLAKKVPGLNIFDYKNGEDRERAIQAFLTMMKSISGDNWGPETERILNAAADAVLSHFERPSVLHVYLFVARKEFRDKVAAESKNAMLADFVKQYDEELRASERMGKFSPPLNKLDKFIRPVVRTLIGQDSSLDFKGIMDSKTIVIVRLSKGQLGATTASIIGSIILSHVSIAALRRGAERSPFVVIVDEVHNFVHGVDLPTLLAEARKYGISLILATQNLAQLPSAESVFGNCSNIVSYKMGGQDAVRMALELGSPDLSQAIANMADRTFCATTVHNGLTIRGEQVKALPPIKRFGDESDSRKVMKVAFMQTGDWREELDTEVLRFLATGVPLA